MRTEQLHEYNHIVLKTFGRKPCDKTPNELWESKESATEKFTAERLAAYAGYEHRVTFTKAGLTVQHKGKQFTYFPAVNTEEDRQQALQLFSTLKVNSPESSKRTLYILDYSAGAYVWTKNWEKGKFLGFFRCRSRFL